MIDQPVADFTLDATGGQPFQLSAARGAPLVIYFYPKDSTPGCTNEAGQFRDLHAAFARLGCTIVGISRDGIKSHENFKAKLGLPFELLSDGEEVACNLFGVIKQKKLYGKLVRGIERSTFLLDRHGVLRREWRGIKVDGHAAEVLEAVAGL
ncbi:putative peroxiredoxin bcp [Sterolibacterium denitrificans]|uniref:thioredoxin-dependent peroxiredoxin n=1 Tax=Sterolibacterium denitrificans TaxID=157592 RepID=A0A7Z7HSI2_9PROT|nr:peroxiredoxin [Sterolibacterium denitrificans]SMB25213.1 putative peroxiredoxin bcp [Sterolibacterium denitrificans]